MSHQAVVSEHKEALFLTKPRGMSGAEHLLLRETAVPQQICGEGDEAEGLVLRKAEERVVERGGSERIPSRVKRARAPRSCRVRLTVRADEL